MNPYNLPTSLVTKHGQSIPLQGVRAQGRLDGLVFTLEVEQRYQNPLPDSVEAVYTFPLPSRAVLLALELEVGGQKLAAVATAKAEAKRRYEAAIDNGDTTVLLEHNGHGLYTVSLGHLRAGEAATIRYRYVELLDAFEGFVRLAVPTVIAPRYGDPAAAGLSGPAVATNSFLAEYPFDIEILLAGLANDAGLRSPSHATHAVATAEGVRVTLRRQGFLDKDFVLQLQAASLPQRALVARDGEGWAVLASPAYATAAQPDGPFTVKVLLDCSGSMGGERIENAKRALSQFLRNLSVEDRFSLTCFGSNHQHVTAGLETLDKAVREALLLRVRDIDADLGGTNMAEALDATLKIRAPRGTDILLITDGEVHDVNSSLKKVAKAGHRLFVVAIGAAPNEALATALATETGGAVEFVRDEQDAEEAILRMFKRLRTPAADVGRVDWADAKPAWTLPVAKQVFNGDTLHLAAGFSSRPVGTVKATVGNSSLPCPIPLEETAGDWLPRLLAARRLASLPADDARALAVRHNLVSEYTSMVVVAKREDGQNPENLPVTVAVPQMEVNELSHPMLRRVSSVEHCLSLALPSSVVASRRVMGAPLVSAPSARSARSAHSAAPSGSVLQKVRGLVNKVLPPQFQPAQVDSALASIWLKVQFQAMARGEAGLQSLVELVGYGASGELLEKLQALVDEGHEEADVVTAFMAWLAAQFPLPAMATPEQSQQLIDAVLAQRFRGLRSALNKNLKAA